MAIIIPFADADAHGSICDTVSFRRSRGKVVFQKKPKPKQPNTQAQQDQKQWWKDTWQEWRGLSAGQLAWLQAEAAEAETTRANYFFDKIKDEHGASGERQYLIKSIVDMVIDTPIGSAPGHIAFEFIEFTIDPPGGSGLGTILDNENDWHPASPIPPPFFVYLRIHRYLDPPVTIPDNYSITITYTTADDVQHQDVLYFPELELAILTDYFYWFDTSMSFYTEQALENMVKENFWPYPWPPFG